MTQTAVTLERRRTGWDLILGVLLVIGGLVILGNVVLASVMSVLFIGWITLISGVIGLIGAVFQIGKPGFWSAVLSGGLLTVLGIVFVRNPGAVLLALTLITGMVFLVSGISRIAGSAEFPQARVLLIISGIISAVFGVIILFNIVTASLTLLGTLLGIQVILDGITIALVGRVRLAGSKATEPVA